MLFRWIGLLSVTAVCAANATLDFQVALEPFKDNTIFSDQAAVTELSNGAGDFLFAGNTANGIDVTRRALLAFDLTGIPANAVITDAQIRLRSTREAVSTVASDFSLSRITADWGEGSSDATGQEGRGAAATTGDATWQHQFFDQAFWSVVGGDFVTTPSAIVRIDGLGFYTFSGQGLIDDVQQFVDDPATNFGWILRGDETREFTARQFGSRNDPDTGPRLSISYSVIPEPDIGVLLILGGGVLLCLRWRSRILRGA